MNNIVTLVATDLDGTLLSSEKKVSQENRDAIKRLKTQGILFGIASGRPVETVRAMLQEWEIEDSVSFILGMNGGVVYDMRQRERDEYHLLDGKVIMDIMDFFGDLNVHFQILVGSTRYTNKSTPETRAHAKLYGETEIETDLYALLATRDVNKLIIYCDPKDMPLIKERASHYHDDRCVGFDTANNLFEYVDPRINKGFGIEKVCKHFGTSLEHAVAFGDAGNDVEMLKRVGCGVCMQNGSDEAKMAADIVSIYTNDESALARYLIDHVLEENENGYLG